MAYYLNPNKQGLQKVSSLGDGDSLIIKWFRAYPNQPNYKIAYNIYMDEVRPDFEFELFLNPPSFVSISNILSATITDLNPGQTYRFGVRAIEYSTTSFDFSSLPSVMGGLRIYPQSQLRESISDEVLIIPLLDASDFPSVGTIKIGTEIINYSSVDYDSNDLILASLLQRGYGNTAAQYHIVDGYLADDYATRVVLYPAIDEEKNTVVYAKENGFDYPNYAFTFADGYRQTTQDLINGDLSFTETANETFPAYDTSGYRRIDTAALLRGECVGSYYGGEQGCVDGYGISHRTRGLSASDVNNQRDEKILALTGQAMVLLKRQTTGIRCICINPQQEHPDARCIRCLGTGFQIGYFQWFNSRRSDRRIMVRFESWTEQSPLTDSGLEVEQVRPNAWTASSPIIHPRDIIIRFNQDGNEEFRYEVLNVTRNVLFEDQLGSQKLALARIRKTDHIYSAPYMKDASKFPREVETTSSLSIGVPLHKHTIVTNESTPDKWSQLTCVSAGHNHQVRYNRETGTLEIVPILGHTHTLSLT